MGYGSVTCLKLLVNMDSELRDLPGPSQLGAATPVAVSAECIDIR
jgi:hypothetical protein